MFAVFFSIFLDLVGFGIIIPLLPFYAEHYGATAFMVTWLATSFSLFQLIFSTLLGRLSDRFGRRPIFLSCLALSALAYLWMGFAESFLMLMIARSISGMAAGKISVAQAIIADVTTPENRAKGMGLIGAAFGLGFVTGPAIGGLLVGNDPANPDFQTPMFVAAALSFAGLILAFFTVKESLTDEEKQASKTTSHLSLKEQFNLVVSAPYIPWLIGLFFIVSFVFVQVETIFALWTERNFNWTPRILGYCFAYIGVIMVIMQGGLIGPLTRKFGEPKLTMTGLILLSTGLLLTITSYNFVVFMFAVTVITLGIAMVNPSITSMVSQAAPKGQQGVTLGIANSASGLGRVLGPLWAGSLFDFVHYDAPFISGGLIIAVFVLLLYRFVYTKLYGSKRPASGS